MVCGVISGRDLRDVKGKVNLNELYYAGSHGYEISGPESLYYEYEAAHEKLPSLDTAEKSLNDKLKHIAGVYVERKKYAIAIHYREAEKDVEEIKSIVSEVANQSTDLKVSGGKKILEVQPSLEWDKGKALLWLLKELNLSLDNFLPLYIGDDVTDEDAFDALHGKGISIRVSADDSTTKATYLLKDVREVILFMDILKKNF